jgi:hypothetical protein
MRPENLPFRIESELFRRWYALTGARPSSKPFVSGDSFRALADHIVEPRSHLDPGSVHHADVVFVQSTEIRGFIKTFLPEIGEPFVLITHNGDLNIDETFLSLADDRRIIHWFAQNALLRHSRLTSLPIGIENRALHTNGVVRDFRKLARRRLSRRNRILFGFTVANNPGERKPAYDALCASPIADSSSPLNSRRYRKLLGKYAFVASPPGNGIDCHRTWEALYLGVVPILKRSPFYDSFPGLPALFIDQWDEVIRWDEAYLSKMREQTAPRFESLPYLRFEYWQWLIDEARCR